MTKKSSVWSDLPRRAATICIGFPVVWKILSSQRLAKTFFVCVHFLCSWEFSILEPKSQTHQQQQQQQDLSLTTRLAFCVASLVLAHVDTDSLFYLLTCGMTGIWILLKGKQHWIVGIFVLTIPFRTWYKISQDFTSTIAVLLVVWNCDTGALLLGRLSSKIFPQSSKLSVPLWIQAISPAKSMEGFLGGVLGGTWTAVSWIPFLTKSFNMETTRGFDALWSSSKNRFLLGIIMSILAIFGDLVVRNFH
jgi:CDP-diglyceride synthetase